MKRPTKADRMIVANHDRAAATMMRSEAETLRHNAQGMTPEAAAVALKLAAQSETRAARLERVADWMCDV